MIELIAGQQTELNVAMTPGLQEGVFFSAFGFWTPFYSRDEMFQADLKRVRRSAQHGIPYFTSLEFPPTTYTGPIAYVHGWMKDVGNIGETGLEREYRCRLCDRLVYEYLEGRWVGAPPSTYDHAAFLTAFYAHLEGFHPEFPWNMVKGGLAALKYARAWGPIPERNEVRYGEILLPGTYTRWDPSVTFTIPGNGDRFYLLLDPTPKNSNIIEVALVLYSP